MKRTTQLIAEWIQARVEEHRLNNELATISTGPGHLIDDIELPAAFISLTTDDENRLEGTTVFATENILVIIVGDAEDASDVAAVLDSMKQKFLEESWDLCTDILSQSSLNPNTGEKLIKHVHIDGILKILPPAVDPESELFEGALNIKYTYEEEFIPVTQ